MLYIRFQKRFIGAIICDSYYGLLKVTPFQKGWLRLTFVHMYKNLNLIGFGQLIFLLVCKCF